MSPRRPENIARTGRVEAVDHTAPAPRARVRDGALLTDWLPVMAPRAGADRLYLAPTVGEQVLLISPEGDLSRGLIIGSLPTTDHPAPVTEPGVHRAEYEDGAVIEYDRTAHRLRVDLPAGAEVEITAPGGLKVTGDLTVTGRVTSGTVDLATHTHTATQPGSGASGPPTP